MTGLPAERSSKRPRIAVFSMGGTIAMSARGEAGVSPGLDARDLLTAVPGMETVVEVAPIAHYHR